MNIETKFYFSDYFDVSPQILDDYGAFNISIINDLPFFIDPFLLFNSKNPKYQELHENIIKYLRFLKEKSNNQNLEEGLIKLFYTFPEIKQNWLGLSLYGNSGSGLGMKFARSLHENLHLIFNDFGSESITKSSHLEKLCLIEKGVGKDNISDFTTNLIFEYLLYYSQTFAQKYIDITLRKKHTLNHVKFNYNTESWESISFDLPTIKGDFVLLTPSDILTKDDTWINKNDLYKNFELIPQSISDQSLRAQVNNYFQKVLPRIPVDPKDPTVLKEPTTEEKKEAAKKTIKLFPQTIDFYLKYKEDHSKDATIKSNEKIQLSKQLYLKQFRELILLLKESTEFYKTNNTDSYEESMNRIEYLKDIIENKDGYKLFYLNNEPIKKETDLQIAFRFVWYGTNFDVNSEVNNGRGPVDFKVSLGKKEQSLIEFKLASNTQLKRNLQNQLEIYAKANYEPKLIKVIMYFTEKELNSVKKILAELKMTTDKNIILIDARSDNKPSASKA